MMSEKTATWAGLVGEARCIWSLLLTLWPVGRPAEPCTTALQAGRTTTTLLLVRLCSLGEPTGPAQVSRAYRHMMSPGRGVFQQATNPSDSHGGAMTVKTYIKATLLFGLVALSIGGFFLHLRIHPIAKNPANIVPIVSGVLGIVIVPLLFLSRKLISYGYVINGMEAIIGTVLMAHYSIAHWPAPVTPAAIIFETLLADVLVLWGKFFLGKALFELEIHGYDQTRVMKGKTYRYPNYGWWLIHLGTISLVYCLGHVLWR
jgi:hypothetical protein